MQASDGTTNDAESGQGNLESGHTGSSPHEKGRVAPNLIPIKRVVMMMVASDGLYFFYWFYLTWKQYRDHTSEEAFPFWHTMTQSVPVYGLFRVHAHMGTFAELIGKHGTPSTIRPKWAVAVILISTLLSLASWLITLQGHLSQGQALMALALAIVQTAMVAWLLVGVQSNLNSYWNSISTGASRAKVGAGEVVLAILGSISWLLTIAAVASESFRSL